VRQGLNSYILTCRETKQDFVHVDFKNTNDDKISRALRLVSMSISENLLIKWFDFVWYNLDCMRRERRDFERRHREGKDSNVFLLPHEFLFLLCNCQNRLDIINKVHKVDLTSDYGDVYWWEIAGSKSLKQIKEAN
jgi:hypothetical protein